MLGRFKAVFQSQLEPSLLFFFIVEFNVALLWCHVTHENEVQACSYLLVSLLTDKLKSVSNNRQNHLILVNNLPRSLTRTHQSL